MGLIRMEFTHLAVVRNLDDAGEETITIKFADGREVIFTPAEWSDLFDCVATVRMLNQLNPPSPAAQVMDLTHVMQHLMQASEDDPES